MSRNRKRPAERDENEEPPNSKTMESEILKEIRLEIKKNQAESEKKIEDLKIAILEQKLESLKENQKIRQKLDEIEMETKKEVATLKSELLAETQQKLEEIEKKNEEKLSKLKKEMLEEMKKIQKVPGPTEIPPSRIPKIEPPSDTAPEVPIREDILGEWKIVEHENFEGFKKIRRYNTLKSFCQNVKYNLVGGKLKQTGGAFLKLIEGEGNRGKKDLFVEDNHVKSFWKDGNTVDRYIENGKLYVIRSRDGDVWKRVYKKIG